MRKPNDQLAIFRQADIQLTDPADPTIGIRPSLNLDPWDMTAKGFGVSFQIFHILPNHQMSTM